MKLHVRDWEFLQDRLVHIAQIFKPFLLLYVQSKTSLNICVDIKVCQKQKFTFIKVFIVIEKAQTTLSFSMFFLKFHGTFTNLTQVL